MARMLGALVGSMTIGALCLDWMQPARPVSPVSPGIELMAVGPRLRVWEGIRVQTCPQDDLLRPEESHFLVYRNGSPARTVSWEAQRVLGATPLVRVTLLTMPGSQGLTAAQRSAAQTLLARLQKELSIPDRRVVGADTLAHDWPSRSPQGDSARTYAVAAHVE